METVLSILFWGGLMFLMMRFGCGKHMFGHGRKQEHKQGRQENPDQCCGTASGAGSGLRWEAPESDVDPVCGKTVSTAEARPSLYEGQVYYFCSRECRETFEARPENYVGQEAPREIPAPERSPAE